MQEIDFVAEIIYRSFERIHRLKLPENYSENFKAFHETLNENQRALFSDFDAVEFEHIMACKREVIKFILEIMCPNAFP